MKEVQLTQDKVSLVDDEDFALVSQHNWHLNECENGSFYARSHIELVNGKSKKIKMHQLILNVKKGERVVHINGDGLDNRRENIHIQEVNTYKNLGETTEIIFHGGNKTIIDTEDLEKVRDYIWIIDKDTNGIPYVRGHKGKSKVRLHRLILEAPKGKQVDHKNHDTLDNRKENLRICTHTENTQNQLKLKTRVCSSQYKGVSWMKSCQKWYTYIGSNKKRINLGFFESEEVAAKAYNEKALEIYGEFALLNDV